ncbi:MULTISPECIES: helix-turn-helix domain-containing GNAT family N-acetyltransferase [unclassified Bradyrhizobium]|uniref:bifunctional helix-turn-helix transcriptional regulator/GNAT family N-acetyltransferase n=1 Tax=unclassified Bradyrhizobium TaxID=2631580 RepID=UPI0024796491|nr:MULTISPECIES: helix-turn-helix domain-containing GNAT family N-acetyltransferase [unclassified Bradyrhizobium]WGS22158.1 helix-turn-helix domain-containing GNAT family N-acetyltransferase [Bradyrhizobium sp. ISRA463]WGS29121.1 helix-turn-helix domain-containing GNAT family N-acetyltransferase [Bradyrhizobium sp. ISRA464]
MKSNISNDTLESQVAAVRGFSRFYTRKLGIIEPKLLHSPFTLQEARIIYEIAHHDGCTATDLVRELDLDAGFVSRTLAALQRRQIVTRTPSKADKRVNEVTLTAKGRAAASDLDSRSRSEVAALLKQMDGNRRAAVVRAMGTIEQSMEPAVPKPAGFLLRSHRVGDMGWVISRHGAVYAQEYGWDISFEALVAEIAAQFLKSFDPACEHCWISEVDGEPVGSIFLVNGGDKVAKLRLLLVEERARGLGVGRALVEQCIRFAREKGYSKITLWTQSILVAARGIYARAGFQRVKEEKHHSFGVDLVGETWELEL